MSSKGPQSYRAPALAKGLEILELLATAEESLPQAEIARRTGRSVNELFRMLSELETLGYLRRDASGAYGLTLKLFCIAGHTRGFDLLVRLAAKPMREYAHKTAQECHLCVLEDGKLIVLANYNSHQAVSLNVRSGSTHHPLKTASGRLLLAQLSEEEQRWHLQRAKDSFPKIRFAMATELKKLTKLRGESELDARDESLSGLADFVVLLSLNGRPFDASLASSWFTSGADAKAEEAIHQNLRLAADQLRSEISRA